MNLAHTILDIYDDLNIGQSLQKVAGKLPKEIRAFDLPSRDFRDTLDDSQFALSIITKTASKLNKFPINDELNTTLSSEYFDVTHDKLPSEAQRIAATYIKLACERFDVTPSYAVKHAAEKFPVMTNIYLETASAKAGGVIKEASKSKHTKSEFYYGLVKIAKDGHTERAYALPNADAIAKASEYFDKYAMKFSPEDRHQFSFNVINRAIELGVNVPSEGINKYAGSCYGTDVDAYLSVRKELLSGRVEFVNALEKLATYQGKEDPKTFAKVLHEFDKKAGLVQYYDNYLADPYASTFGSTVTKTASVLYEIDSIQVTDDSIQNLVDSKLNLLKNYFGSTLADGLKKEGSAAFVALPDDAKEVIARMVNGEIQ